MPEPPPEGGGKQQQEQPVAVKIPADSGSQRLPLLLLATSFSWWLTGSTN
jgi:hypothetical protein